MEEAHAEAVAALLAEQWQNEAPGSGIQRESEISTGGKGALCERGPPETMKEVEEDDIDGVLVFGVGGLRWGEWPLEGEEFWDSVAEVLLLVRRGYDGLKGRWRRRGFRIWRLEVMADWEDR